MDNRIRQWIFVSCLTVGLTLFCVGQPIHAATYYVRPDGGTCGQCNGMTDAAYQVGAGNMNCAWSHPFYALEPGEPPTWKIQGGDTLMVYPGSYRMGFGAPNTDWCDAGYPWDCTLPPLPSGPDADHPTRVLGIGWDQGCPAAPELWGTERAYFILNLNGTSHAQIQCLELTDHESCVESHADEQVQCRRDSYPFGDWADTGIYAADSSDILLKNLNMHGFAAFGIQAGGLTDWTLENVRIAGNGWGGWNGDLSEENDSNSGTLAFENVIIEWNGCGETYPNQTYHNCWAQSAGGYGDGLGTARTGGHWVIEDSIFRYNTSDGLDLLYVREPNTQIDIRRSQAYGNAGDQFKTSGPAAIENCLAVSECGFFDGKPFTYHVDPCRAGGSAVALGLRPGNRASLVHSTIAGQGSVLLLVECEGSDCGDSEVIVANNIFREYQEFLDPTDVSTHIWYEPAVFGSRQIDYNLVYYDGGPLRLGNVPLSEHDINQDPLLMDDDLGSLDYRLQENSPAIDAGLPMGGLGGVLPDHDIGGTLRPNGSKPDMGCYEFTNQTLPQVVVLTGDQPNAGVANGHSALIYGTASPNQVTLESGASAELIHFPGSNTIQVQASSQIFSVSRSGAWVTFNGTDGTVLKLPASLSAQSLVFSDKTLSLKIQNGQVMLGTQVIGYTEAQVL